MRMRSLASWVRESVLQLGPTFIKLGQLFSTRSDLFPAEFTEVRHQLGSLRGSRTGQTCECYFQRRTAQRLQACVSQAGHVGSSAFMPKHSKGSEAISSMMPSMFCPILVATTRSSHAVWEAPSRLEERCAVWHTGV